MIVSVAAVDTADTIKYKNINTHTDRLLEKSISADHKDSANSPPACILLGKEITENVPGSAEHVDVGTVGETGPIIKDTIEVEPEKVVV